MAKRGRKKGQKGKCSVCGVEGHTKRTCPTLKKTAEVSKTSKKSKKSKTSKKSKKSEPAPEVSENTSEVAPAPTKEEIAAILKRGAEFDLNRVVWNLLQQEPFFAAMSRYIDKTSTMRIPTAAVGFNKDSLQFELLYNPVFMGNLTRDQQVDVLKHEFYHVVFDHVTGRMPPDCRENKEVMLKWNYATDLAINSYLSNLPEGCLKPGQGIAASLPPEKNAEWYFSNLTEEMKEQIKQQAQQGQGGEGESESEGGQGQNGQGQGNPTPGVGKDGRLDDHSSWSGSKAMDEQTKEFARERMKEIARKAVNESNESASWGTVSEDVRSRIMKMLYSCVDWKKVLRYFIKTSQKANKSSSIRRINKRYPYVHAGKKNNRTANLAIAIDESGSVGDRLLGRFFGELNKLADLATFTVIPFDHEVSEKEVYVWRKGTHRLPDRVKCGGTCFDAPTRYVNDRNFDGMIVLTDMCAPKPGRCKVQRLWMTSEQHAQNPHFNPAANERVVAIRDNEQ